MGLTKYLNFKLQKNFIIFRKFNRLIICSKASENILSFRIPFKFIIFDQSMYISVNQKCACSIKFKLFNSKFIVLFYNFLYFLSEKLTITGIGLKSKELNSFVYLRLGFSHYCCVFFDFPINITFEKNALTIISFFSEEINEVKKKFEYLKFPNSYKKLGIQLNSKVYKKKTIKKD